MVPVAWLSVAAAAYAGGATLFALHVAGRGPRVVTATRTGGLALGALAVVLHAIALRTLLFVPNGIDLGYFQVLSLVGWQIAVVVLLATARLPIAGVAVAVLPITALAALAPAVFESSAVRASTGWHLEAHILLSLLAYSLLAVAAVQALVLAVQDRQLRRHRPGGWVRALPPLEAMESLLFRLIAAGFVLLGCALATGFAFVDDLLAQHLVHKTVLSAFAWVLFGILLWGRWRRGWRGRTALRWTLSAFVLLALGYFGSKFVLELILGRHWG
ncbi:MAG: cytochrome c biogenesis protein CcsA [Gammaproteobacteria bacterium]